MDGASTQSKLPLITYEDNIYIREIQQYDIRALVQMYHRTSRSSLYARYLRHHTPEYDELNELCHLLPYQAKCLVAVSMTPLRSIVGIAHYVIQADKPQVAEPAILVEDGRQLRGIGTRLFLALSQLAVSDGIQQFEGIMSANNRTIIGMLKKCNLAFTTHYAYGTFDVKITL